MSVEVEAMSTPKLVKIKSGWAALGNGWAVHGTTEEEAVAKFKAAEAKHQEIDARPLPTWDCARC